MIFIFTHALDLEYSGGVRLALVVPVAYLLGCANAAYYLTKWRTRQDIRTLGTGTAGATNAGRTLGKGAFVSVFLFDFAKGAAAVGLATWMDLAPSGLGIVAWSVTAGHIWPFQLGFRGGKGIAAALGSLLAFDLAILGVLAALFLPIYVACRRFSLSGLIAFALCPLAIWILHWPTVSVRFMTALTLLIWVAHRSNLVHEFRVSDTPPPGRSHDLLQ